MRYHIAQLLGLTPCDESQSDEYKTNVEEVIKALELADDDKKIIVEDENKIVVICELRIRNF